MRRCRASPRALFACCSKRGAAAPPPGTIGDARHVRPWLSAAARSLRDLQYRGLHFRSVERCLDDERNNSAHDVRPGLGPDLGGHSACICDLSVMDRNLKSTRIGMRSVMDHILAMVLFVCMLVEFLLVGRAATSTFFLLTAIALVDVLAGFIVGMRSSQRQIEIEGAGRP